MIRRKSTERKFHNILRRERSIFSEEYDYFTSNEKWYLAAEKSRRFVSNWLTEAVPNRRVLDYCCGNGEMTVFIASRGAEIVIGVDISDVSLENAKRLAKKKGLADKTEFLCMDAENLTFDDDYFDVIFESGVLHHLDLDKAYYELSRVLAKKGRCICVEALRHNPIFHAYRKMTPHLRTQWETDHILGKKEVEAAKKYFTDVKILGFFHLFSVTAVLFRNLRIYGFILKMLNAIDDYLLEIPGLRWFAWQVVFEMSNPIKLTKIH